MSERRERLETACFRLGSISITRDRSEDELIEALIRQAHVYADGWRDAEEAFAALLGKKASDFNSMEHIRRSLASALLAAQEDSTDGKAGL